MAGSPRAGSDPLAVAALVLGILGIIVVAIPLAVASLARTRPGSNRGPATAALAVSAGWALVAAVAVIALIPSLGTGRVVAASTPSPSATASSPPVTPSTEIGFAEIRVGDCIESEPGPSSGSMTRVSCTVPHELELIAIRELGSGRWPGRQVIDTRGDRLCMAAFQSYIGIPFDQSELDLIPYLPDEETWRQGDHTVHCFAAHLGPKKAGTVRGSRR